MELKGLILVVDWDGAFFWTLPDLLFNAEPGLEDYFMTPNLLYEVGIPVLGFVWFLVFELSRILRIDFWLFNKSNWLNVTLLFFLFKFTSLFYWRVGFDFCAILIISFEKVICGAWFKNCLLGCFLPLERIDLMLPSVRIEEQRILFSLLELLSLLFSFILTRFLSEENEKWCSFSLSPFKCEFLLWQGN